MHDYSALVIAVAKAAVNTATISAIVLPPSPISAGGGGGGGADISKIVIHCFALLQRNIDP